MTDSGRNGHGPGSDGADEVDDLPLDAEEEAAGSAAAEADAGESLGELIDALVRDLRGVARSRGGELDLLSVGDRVFAAVGDQMLEVALDGPVAKAALATPDTRPSSRGAGWVAFTPATVDRFALDRAAAWIRLAYRRAGGRDG